MADHAPDARNIAPHPLLCPGCGYDMRGCASDVPIPCPECGRELTRFELIRVLDSADSKGMPATMNPHEVRIAGPWLMAASAIGLLLVLIGLQFLTTCS